MKNILKKTYLFYFPLLTIFIYSCSKDDPDGINEQEYISNVVVSVTSADGELQTIDWDLSETNMEAINLKINSSYNVGLSFENRSDPTDIEDITIEIIDEAPKDFSLDLFFCLEAIKRGRIKEFNVYFKKRLYETSKGGGGTLIQKFKIIKRTIDYINKTKR